MKLSKPQEDLIKLLFHQPGYVAHYYPPLKVLVRYGLVEESVPGRSRWKLTDKGKHVAGEILV